MVRIYMVVIALALIQICFLSLYLFKVTKLFMHAAGQSY